MKNERETTIVTQEVYSRDAALQYESYQAMLTILNGFTAAVSQYHLSPIYGFIPAARHREKIIAFAVIAAVFTNFFNCGRSKIFDYTVCVSLGLYALIVRYCTWLGPENGPWVTELLTLCPLIYSTMDWAAVNDKRISTASISGIPPETSKLTTRNQSHKFISTFMRLVAHPILLFTAIEKMGSYFRSLLSKYSPLLTVVTRRRLWYGTNLAHFLLPSGPSSRRFRALAALCLFWPWDSLNDATRQRTLNSLNFTILDSKESITGYISVIQNTRTHLRALRCDHSLLGGVWLPEGEWKKHGIVMPETIYTVFTMLEAVRLMEPWGKTNKETAGARSALVM